MTKYHIQFTLHSHEAHDVRTTVIKHITSSLSDFAKHGGKVGSNDIRTVFVHNAMPHSHTEFLIGTNLDENQMVNIFKTLHEIVMENATIHGLGYSFDVRIIE